MFDENLTSIVAILRCHCPKSTAPDITYRPKIGIHTVQFNTVQFNTVQLNTVQLNQPSPNLTYRPNSGTTQVHTITQAFEGL